MLQIFGYLAGLSPLVAVVPYIRDIFKLKTKPQRASWFIWLVLGSIAFSSQFAKGATDSLWMTGAQTFEVLFVFILSIKYGVGGFVRKDIYALIAAMVGLLLWYLTSEAAVALYIVIGIDAIGSFLTIEKSYHDPESETVSSWVLFSLSGLFGSLAVGSLNIILLSYPIYIFLANSITLLAIILGKRRLS
jgi:uncharacterized membrane protein YuzA (DUF378 family)